MFDYEVSSYERIEELIITIFIFLSLEILLFQLLDDQRVSKREIQWKTDTCHIYRNNSTKKKKK